VDSVNGASLQNFNTLYLSAVIAPAKQCHLFAQSQSPRASYRLPPAVYQLLFASLVLLIDIASRRLDIVSVLVVRQMWACSRLRSHLGRVSSFCHILRTRNVTIRPTSRGRDATGRRRGTPRGHLWQFGHVSLGRRVARLFPVLVRVCFHHHHTYKVALVAV